MATPAAVERITDQTFVSTLDLHEEQILDKMYQRYGDQGQSYMFLRALGFETPVAGDNYGHFEEDYYHEVIKQKAATASSALGAGTAQGIRLTLDNSYVDTAGNYYPRVGDKVMFTTGETGWIDSIDDSASPDVTVDIYSDDGGAITALSGGETAIIYSGVHPEGSGMPDPASGKVIYYDNDLQIIKEAIGITGSELANESRISLYNKAGEFQGYYRKNQKELDYRHLLKIDGAFLFGQRITSTKVPSYNETGDTYMNKGTQGLYYYMEDNAHTNTYTAGSWDITKIDEYDRLLEAEFISKKTPLWMPMGLNLYQEVKNDLVDELANTNVQFARQAVNDMLFKGNESMGATFNFQYLQTVRTYMLDLLGGFSNPKLYGATGFDFPKYGMVIPLDQRSDPRTGRKIPTIGMRYKAWGAYNRRFKMDTIAGIGSTLQGEKALNTIDKRRTYQMCHMGTEFFGGNRMILIKSA